MKTHAEVDAEIERENHAITQLEREHPRTREVNATGMRTTIIVSPYGTSHAPRKTPSGAFIRRMDWRLTLCGQIAEHGWSQRRVYGYVDCKSCIARMEARAEVGI